MSDIGKVIRMKCHYYSVKKIDILIIYRCHEIIIIQIKYTMESPNEIMQNLYYYGENGMIPEFNKLLYIALDKKIVLDSSDTNELYHYLLKESNDKDILSKKNIVSCALDLEVYENIVLGI